jgi:hypothetical protein
METALALGLAVDEQVSWPSGYVEGEVAHHDQWSWPKPFTTSRTKSAMTSPAWHKRGRTDSGMRVRSSIGRCGPGWEGGHRRRGGLVT